MKIQLRNRGACAGVHGPPLSANGPAPQGRSPGPHRWQTGLTLAED